MANLYENQPTPGFIKPAEDAGDNAPDFTVRDLGVIDRGIDQQIVMGREWTGYWLRLEDRAGGNASYLSRNPVLRRSEALDALKKVSAAVDCLEDAGLDIGCTFRIEVLHSAI